MSSLNPLTPRRDQLVTSPLLLLPYIIQKTGYKNTQTYKVEVFILILLQILITNLQGNVRQPEGRFNNQILVVKGLLIIAILFSCSW